MGHECGCPGCTSHADKTIEVRGYITEKGEVWEVEATVWVCDVHHAAMAEDATREDT